MRVKHINAINFKGFPTLDVDFTGTSVVLGGMNGFGKTTIFDALELLLTGSIHRMVQYSSNLPNHRFSRSQSQLPLVCDMGADEVVVSVTLELEGTEFTLQRRARVAEMKNPVDFAPFSNLCIFDTRDLRYRPISEEEQKSLGLEKWAQDYNFLNYLSQEEATSFLKCKDSERTDLIQKLFDTQMYDTPINKIGDVLSVIDKVSRRLSETCSQLERDINSLRSVSLNGGTNEYVRLCTTECPWDVEDPKLSFEDYNAMVSEGGSIDGLLYFLKNENAYRQNNRNRIIGGYLADNTIDNYLFFKSCLNLKKQINSYSVLSNDIVKPITSLSSGNIIYLHLDKVELLANYISHDKIAEGQLLINNYIASMRSANQLQKIAQSILEDRTSMANHIQKHNDGLKISVCPLCGSEYESYTTLSSAISDHEELFKASFSQFNKGLSEQFAIVKEYLVLNIIAPIQRYFGELGVSDELVERYKNINELDIDRIDSVLNRLYVTYTLDGNLEDNIADLKSKLHSLILPVDESVDMALLQRIYSSYMKHIDRSVFTSENLEKKRGYLLSRWNQKQTELLKQKQKELDLTGKRLAGFRKRKNDLKQLQGQIKQQKTNYVNKVISDIQILFYIYSGRILQDNYFGRGLFLKPDIAKNRILFVSGNYNENDVDALYNMSSGQLVAVAVSFMLSLNRLYSKVKYIAIDDPVQTIDDINLWGLMETLRHDFKDRFILLSTHEKNYGQLLDYKFRKSGISSEYIDMGDKHVS